MKTALEFLLENQEAIKKKLGGKGDYVKMYPQPIVLALMSDFADYATDQPEETQDLENLLVAFCWDLKQHGVCFNEDYTQEDFERIVYAFFVEDEEGEE